jgi:hypothetical protein
LKYDFKYFILLLASSFAHGGALEGIFWFFYLLGIFGSRDIFIRNYIPRAKVEIIEKNLVLLGN